MQDCFLSPDTSRVPWRDVELFASGFLFSPGEMNVSPAGFPPLFGHFPITKVKNDASHGLTAGGENGRGDFEDCADEHTDWEPSVARAEVVNESARISAMVAEKSS